MTNQEKNIPTSLTLVAAVAQGNRVIGDGGRIPWHLPLDLALFRELTLGGCLLMGRKTWESLSAPLDDRLNLVLSSNLESAPGAEIHRNLDTALQRAASSGRRAFVIGGSRIYCDCLPLATAMVISWVEGSFDGDCFFPEFDQSQWRVCSKAVYPGFSRICYRRS